MNCSVWLSILVSLFNSVNTSFETFLFTLRKQTITEYFCKSFAMLSLWCWIFVSNTNIVSKIVIDLLLINYYFEAHIATPLLAFPGVLSLGKLWSERASSQINVSLKSSTQDHIWSRKKGVSGIEHFCWVQFPLKHNVPIYAKLGKKLAM